MLKIIISICFFLLLFEHGSFSANLEYTKHYYMKRKQTEQRKTIQTKKTARQKNSENLMHTDSFVPACNLYFGVGAEEKQGRFIILVQEDNKVVSKNIAGVVPKKGREDEGVKFLHEMISGNYIKICHPKFESMPQNREYGLIYVEPVLESMQELLLDKGFGVLASNTKEEK